MKDDGLDDSLMMKIKETFGDVLYVKAPGVKDEIAFVTKSIKEGQFAEKIALFDDVYSIIRIDF